MKKNNFMTAVSRTCHQGWNKTKQHSPEIFLGLGITGVLVSTVLACRATLKLPQIIEESKETIDKIHEYSEKEELKEKYTEKDVKQDLIKTYAKTSLQIAKLYAPAVALEVASIASIVTSHNILNKRNITLAAAYTALDESFKQYRKKVAERLGEEGEQGIKYDIKAKKIDTTITDETTGKEKNVKKTVGVSNLGEHSLYAVYFDKSTTPYCEDNMDYNMMFLRSEQSYATDLLVARGQLTLIEVIDRLHIKVSDEFRAMAMVAGWKLDKNNSSADNRVIFDIHQTYKEREDGMIEPTIIIDFNVEGNLYNRLKGVKA